MYSGFFVSFATATSNVMFWNMYPKRHSPLTRCPVLHWSMNCVRPVALVLAVAGVPWHWAEHGNTPGRNVQVNHANDTKTATRG